MSETFRETGDRTMFRKRHSLLAAAALAVALLPAGVSAQPLTVAQARASLIGRWAGELDADPGNPGSASMRWPMATEITDAGDGATLIERQVIRRVPGDGGRLVTIVSMLDRDGATEHRSQLSMGTPPEHTTLTLSLASARDAAHWTLLGVEDYVHQGRALQSRTRTVRNGDTLVIEFEVDPAGEEPAFGQTRWTLRRAAQ